MSSYLYLASFIGNGTLNNPFRPPGTDGLEYSIIDFRADATKQGGFCLLRVPQRNDAAIGGDYLGDDGRITLPTQLRNRLGNVFGVNLESSYVPDVLLELLREHGDDVRTDRWNKLRPAFGRWQIYLGELLVDVPVIGGGATYADDFTRADSSSLGANWTEVAGDVKIVSNHIEAVNASALEVMRWTADFDSDNNWAQCTKASSINEASSITAQVVCRMSDSDDTGYTFGKNNNEPVQRLSKVVAGSVTSLANSSFTWAISTLYTLYVHANGSSIIGRRDGANELAVTDTSITTGKRGGIRFQTNTGATRQTIDSFIAGDILYGPISLVGSTTQQNANAVNSYTVDISGLGVQAGDVVVVSAMHPASGAGITVSGNQSGAYSYLWADTVSNDTRYTTARAAYKRMGATPDTTLTIGKVGSAGFSAACVVMVFRGVDYFTPLDGVAPATATGINGSAANPPSITPVTAGAWVVATYAAASDTNSGTPSGPGNMTGFVGRKGDNTTVVGYAGLAYKSDWVSGAVDPAAWALTYSWSEDSWVGGSFVLRPALSAPVGPSAFPQVISIIQN